MNKIEKDYCKAVGQAIRDLRIEYTKKSCLLFAYENDIPKSTLWRIEKGENEAQLVTLKKIAEGFGWSMPEFFKKIEEKIPNDLKLGEEREVACVCGGKLFIGKSKLNGHIHMACNKCKFQLMQ